MAEDLSAAGSGRAAPPEPWSHNLHYHQVILDAIPPGCGRALDVGCGTGALTRRLRRRVSDVTGIDRDERSIQLARAHPGATGIRYLQAGFLTASLEPASADLVTSIASLHHMDARAALRRMSDLLRPGGVLAVVGLARASWPAELAALIPASAGTHLHLAASAIRRRRAPGRPATAYQPPVIWPPPMTYRDMRLLATDMLPGVRYRHRLYWRYSLVWTKP
jgi:SAM-dependent methyltransferase